MLCCTFFWVSCINNTGITSMPSSSTECTNSSMSWFSILATVGVAATVVNLCWDDLQSASSAVQQNIAGRIQGSFKGIAKGLKRSLSDMQVENANEKQHSSQNKRQAKRATQDAQQPVEEVPPRRLSLRQRKKPKPNYEDHQYRVAHVENTRSKKGQDSQTPEQCITPVQKEKNQHSTDSHDLSTNKANTSAVNSTTHENPNNLTMPAQEMVIEAFDSSGQHRDVTLIHVGECNAQPSNAAPSIQTGSDSSLQSENPQNQENALPNIDSYEVCSGEPVNQLATQTPANSANIDNEIAVLNSVLADTKEELSRKIASVKPTQWITVAGKEDDGSTATWIGQILSLQREHIAVVRYLRPVSAATDIADVDAVDHIQAKIDSVGQCYVFYETRTFKKKFREGFVNLTEVPFMVFDDADVIIHAEWDEVLHSRNSLVSFPDTKVMECNQLLRLALDIGKHRSSSKQGSCSEQVSFSEQDSCSEQDCSEQEMTDTEMEM